MIIGTCIRKGLKSEYERLKTGCSNDVVISISNGLILLEAYEFESGKMLGQFLYEDMEDLVFHWALEYRPDKDDDGSELSFMPDLRKLQPYEPTDRHSLIKALARKAKKNGDKE